MAEKSIIKAGFVYFDDIHIIPHFAGPLAAMYHHGQLRVEILTYRAPHPFLYRMLDRLNVPRETVRPLPTYWHRRVIEKIKNRKIPSPYYLFKKHRDLLLRNYDVLIFNDINHEYLYRHKKGPRPRFVLLMHGAGDGEYMIGEKYRETMSHFELITTPGPKISRFFRKMHLPQTRIVTCGYQKFDLVDPDKRPRLFDNDKPVVLYNPHFKRELSSWYRFGPQILEFFYRQKDFNLIFAPHINLFNKRGFLRPQDIPARYFRAPHILIDTGSERAVNMDYTLGADIYLGDVSSQIYEFLYRPRPAVFLNAHRVDWEKNQHYAHWHTGKVLDDIENLDQILHTARQWHPQYLEIQKERLADTFLDPASGKASENITQAILDLMANLVML